MDHLAKLIESIVQEDQQPSIDLVTVGARVPKDLRDRLMRRFIGKKRTLSRVIKDYLVILDERLAEEEHAS